MVSAQAQGQTLPTDSAALNALRHQVLQSMVEEELLVQQAERDTNVKVTDQEVQDQVEQTVQNVRRNYANPADFIAQLHLARFGTEEEWRRFLAEGQRRQILQQRLIELLRQKGKLKPITPTDAQMRQYWQQRKTEQSQRPATVSFRQIVIISQPDSTARARALRSTSAQSPRADDPAVARSPARAARIAHAPRRPDSCRRTAA